MIDKIAYPPYAPSKLNLLLEKLPKLEEQRLHRFIQRKSGHYEIHIDFFLQEFLSRHKSVKEMTDWHDIYIFGYKELHEGLINKLDSDRNIIEAVSDSKIDDIILFLGTGSESNVLYRSIGDGLGYQYPLAIAGTNSCFYNIDRYLDTGNADDQEMVLAQRHEFRHTAIAVVLANKTNDLYLTDYNMIIHEALGGPDYESWIQRPIPRIQADVCELELQRGDFWDWYSTQTRKFGVNDVSFFSNPVAQSFYLDYVYAEGRDFEYWFNEALKLVP